MISSNLDVVMLIHGWVAVFLIAGGIGLVGLRAVTRPGHAITAREEQGFRLFLAGMTLFAWLAVLAGAYWAYPAYRAVPPPGTTDLHAFPRNLLIADPSTVELHAIGMEWKEHVAWFAPILLTAASAIFWRYGAHLARLACLRRTVLALTGFAFATSLVAGAAGALLMAYAPVTYSHAEAAEHDHD